MSKPFFHQKRPFTRDELYAAIDRAKGGRNPGRDAINAMRAHMDRLATPRMFFQSNASRPGRTYRKGAA